MCSILNRICHDSREIKDFSAIKSTIELAQLPYV